MVTYGGDINRLWTSNAQGDIAIVTDTTNAEQAVYNRLMTKLGELDWAEYTNYGNRAWEVLRETNIEVGTQKIQLYTTNTLLQDPRVAEIVDVTVTMTEVYTANIDVTLLLIGEDTPTNIIISMEV